MDSDFSHANFSRIMAGTGTGHLAHYDAPCSTLSVPSMSAWGAARQIRPLNGSEPLSVAWETGGLDTAVLKLLREEKVKATIIGVFGIGRSDDLFFCQSRDFALVVAVVEGSTTVAHALRVTQELCSVLAR